MEFESSYGVFELDLVDLTGDGVEDFVLISGRGRGTSARRETLRVLQAAPDRFNTILEFPASDYFGSGCRWRYLREYAGGSDMVQQSATRALVLTLEVDGVEHCQPPFLAFPLLIPDAGTIKCVYDVGADAMRVTYETRGMSGQAHSGELAPKQ